jgi:hypothetical protein
MYSHIYLRMAQCDEEQCQFLEGHLELEIERNQQSHDGDRANLDAGAAADGISSDPPELTRPRR